MPERSIKRCVARPVDRWPVGSASRVLQLENRPFSWSLSFPIEVGVCAHVAVEGISLHNLPVPRINLIHAITRIQVLQRRHGGTNPARHQRIFFSLIRPVVFVVKCELVLVRMPEKDIGNHVRTVPLDNLVKVICLVRERAAAVPPRGDVRVDPDALLLILGGLELVDQKGEHATVVGVGSVEQRERVVLVLQVAVQSDYFETWVGRRRRDGVGGVVRGGLVSDGGGDPVVVSPEGGDVVVVPGKLLAEGGVVVDGVGRFVVGWGRVVVSESSVDGPADVGLEHLPNGKFGGLDVGARSLVLVVVGDHVACVEGESGRVLGGCTC